jgi:hypothetical protein
MLKKDVVHLIGPVPGDNSSFKHRMRLHQAWWRAFVLGEEPGFRPSDKTQRVCNTILNGEDSKKNFLTPNALKAFKDTLAERSKDSPGLVNEDRVYNNLLSSQPLCFNFFGELKSDLSFAKEVLKFWITDIKVVEKVVFEFAPPENYTNDNSAFDIAFFYFNKDMKKGIFGLECKYTDDFSKYPYKRSAYEDIYKKSGNVFIKRYKQYIAPNYNQLFRNQLIAESMAQHGDIEIVTTGLFCHHMDDNASKIGSGFQGLLNQKERRFISINYQDYITVLQKGDLSWDRREWLMELWARYCATSLSDNIAKDIRE